MPYHFNASIAGISLALLGLSACQPAEVSDPTPSAEPAADVAQVDVTEVEIETVAVETVAHEHSDDAHDEDEHDHDAHDHEEHDDEGHDHEEHDHDAHDHEEHDHDGHDHEEHDHDGHDHEEHDHDGHDHEGHDHDAHDHDHETAGGEAHVHGHAELAVTVDGDSIQVGLISPLANFGLSESNPNVDDYSPYGESVISFSNGDCSQTERLINVETDGQHGYMSVDLTYSCADISAVNTADILLFDAYPGFEEIDAVLLTEDDQAAVELTPNAHTLSFP